MEDWLWRLSKICWPGYPGASKVTILHTLGNKSRNGNNTSTVFASGYSTGNSQSQLFLGGVTSILRLLLSLFPGTVEWCTGCPNSRICRPGRCRLSCPMMPYSWPTWPYARWDQKHNTFSQCWGSVTFWCGSGSADLYLWPTDLAPDPDPTPDPTPFFSDFKDAKK